MPQPPQHSPNSPTIDLTPKRSFSLTFIFIDLISILFWAYVVLSIFFFDPIKTALEIFIAEYVWLSNLRFILFLGVLALISLFINKKNVVFCLLYVLLFPAVLLFWKIPKHVLRTGSLNIVFYFVFSTIGLFKSIKYSIYITFFTALSSTIAIYAENISLLYSSSIIIIILLFLTMINKIISVFKPGDTFIVFRKFSGFWQQEMVKKVQSEDNIPQLSLIKSDDKELATLISNIETALISNRILLFSAKALKAYQNSGIAAMSGIFTTIFLFTSTTLAFSIVYWAIYKINNGNYLVTGTASGFYFFNMSFKAMFFTNISEITPITAVSQSANMLQNFLSLFIGVIFVSIIVTSRNQLLSYQLDETIRKAQADGLAIEKAMLGRYKIDSIEDLVSELRRLKSGSISIIEFFTIRL